MLVGASTNSVSADREHVSDALAVPSTAHAWAAAAGSEPSLSSVSRIGSALREQQAKAEAAVAAAASRGGGPTSPDRGWRRFLSLPARQRGAMQLMESQVECRGELRGPERSREVASLPAGVAAAKPGSSHRGDAIAAGMWCASLCALAIVLTMLVQLHSSGETAAPLPPTAPPPQWPSLNAPPYPGHVLPNAPPSPGHVLPDAPPSPGHVLLRPPLSPAEDGTMQMLRPAGYPGALGDGSRGCPADPSQYCLQLPLAPPSLRPPPSQPPSGRCGRFVWHDRKSRLPARVDAACHWQKRCLIREGAD